MKTLNEQYTAIFCQLIEKMNGQQHLKIDNEPFMPLTIEKVGENITTPYGIGVSYSLCHYYKQNGDLMQDPEMLFLIVDKRDENKTDYKKVVIFPIMLQHASTGIFEKSVDFKDHQLTNINRELQAEHGEFAEMWLRNIKDQGFLNVTL